MTSLERQSKVCSCEWHDGWKIALWFCFGLMSVSIKSTIWTAAVDGDHVASLRLYVQAPGQ